MKSDYYDMAANTYLSILMSIVLFVLTIYLSTYNITENLQDATTSPIIIFGLAVCLLMIIALWKR